MSACKQQVAMVQHGKRKPPLRRESDEASLWIMIKYELERRSCLLTFSSFMSPRLLSSLLTQQCFLLYSYHLLYTRCVSIQSAGAGCNNARSTRAPWKQRHLKARCNIDVGNNVAERWLWIFYGAMHSPWHTCTHIQHTWLWAQGRSY